MNKTLLYTFLLVLLMISASAQEPSAPVGKPTNLGDHRKPYMGVHLGSTGAGLQFAYPIAKRWDLRLTGSYLPQLPYTTSGTEGTVDYSAKYTLRSGIIGLFSDFALSKNRSGIKLSFGAVYSFLKITASRDFREPNYNLDLGNLYLESKKMPISPYLGLILGNQAKARRVSFAFEIGTFYQGKPRLGFTGTGRVAPTANESNRAIIESNVSSLQFYPYGNLQLNFKLGKTQSTKDQKN
ncbi:hypothetical protein [Pedobacter sp. Hv1]|uniref:hypothetical protein n=1 Tax=Pedobacter sp. Hv1 TaxID=1740090 RepID=UPI0006D8C40C|nr:hypothetical protein [Pedobacter sp. Hv1]KQC02673.1 hypothetical protein AQF98_03610 [Pedobacter sp. Hv1]